MHVVTSGLYGAYSRNYKVEWILRRILPMGWHAGAGADNILLRTSAAATYFQVAPGRCAINGDGPPVHTGRALLNTGTSKEE